MRSKTARNSPEDAQSGNALDAKNTITWKNHVVTLLHVGTVQGYTKAENVMKPSNSINDVLYMTI